MFALTDFTSETELAPMTLIGEFIVFVKVEFDTFPPYVILYLNLHRCVWGHQITQLIVTHFQSIVEGRETPPIQGAMRGATNFDGRR
jgi:hypothetical protein